MTMAVAMTIEITVTAMATVSVTGQAVEATTVAVDAAICSIHDYLLIG
jgi:hypothetical protein